MYRRKQALLFFLSILLLTVFFLLPRNYELAGKIRDYAVEFDYQRRHMTVEERKLYRFGSAYRFSLAVSDTLRSKGFHDKALVLVPSTSYFKNYKIDYEVPEPAVIYYYTGLKTVWSNSREAIKADWLAGVSNGQLVVQPVKDTSQLRDSIQAFNKFPPVL